MVPQDQGNGRSNMSFGVNDEVSRLRGQLRATQVMMVIVAAVSVLDYILPGGIPKVSATYSAGGGKVIASAEKDAAGLSVRSANGTLREFMVAKQDSDSALLLYDPSGRPRAEVSVQAAGPAVRLRDSHGMVRIELSVDHDGCKIMMFDEHGGVLWSAP